MARIVAKSAFYRLNFRYFFLVWLILVPFSLFLCMINKMDYSAARSRKVDSLDSGFPRWYLLLAIALMLLEGLAYVSRISAWLESVSPLVLALVQTLGSVMLYWALMRGMKSCYRPLGFFWWLIIAMNLAGCLCTAFFRNTAFSAAVAALTPLAYIPAGILLLIWYRGRLHSLGWGMVIRILLATGLPFLFYFTVGLEGAYMTVLDLSLVLVHFLYVWCIVRVLKF